MPHLVSHTEWERLNAALELILRWNPDFKPAPDSGAAGIYAKLDEMGLLKDFLAKTKPAEETKGKGSK